MKANIPVQVKSRAEANAVKSAVDDPQVVAFLIVIGILKPLRPTQRERVLRFVNESLEDRDAQPTDS